MKIKMEELKNSLFMESKEKSFTGFTVENKNDINNETFEVLKEEAKYVKVIEIANTNLFVREDVLIESLLSDSIKTIEGGDIYEHGYPEARLMPSDHYEKCNESFKESVCDDFNEKINEILNDYLQ